MTDAVACPSLSNNRMLSRLTCMFVCVCRGRSDGVHCVTGGWLTPAVGPGYWEFDVLHQKKTTCKEVQREVVSFFHSPLDPDVHRRTTLYILSIFNRSFCVYFFIDASSLPQDNPTHCFSQAIHEAALVSGPHTSASLYLWSLRPLSPANLCPLLLPDRTLEHQGPAEQLQR